MFDFSIVTTWFDNLLRNTCGLGDFWSILIECVVIGVIILTVYALLAIVLIFMERKVCAYFQCRLGPMRVGPWGIFQVFADVLKMLTKEIFFVDKADKFLYALAPFLVLIGSVGAFAFLPWNKGAQILDFNVGLFLITAISGIGAVGIFLAGWSSNNKYSVISSMRSAMQMISYEISLSLCLVAVVALAQTMSINGIVEAQNDGWFIFKGHIPAIFAFVLMLICGAAECSSGAFDLPEAESELTAGFHTEYSGMGFGFFYLAEYLNLFVVAGISATLFFGGWMPLHIAGLDGFNAIMDYIPGIVWFLAKTFCIIWLMLWVKWTFPRMRIDQLVQFEWKYVMPLALINLVLMTVVVALGWHF